MPEFGGIAYVPRKGRCQEVISKRIINKGLESKIIELVPSAMGKPITETQTRMLYFAYKDLSLVAKLLDYDSVLDIYREAGIAVSVPEDFKLIYEKCKKWKDEDVTELTKMIADGSFGDDWWTGIESPTDKMRVLMRLHYPLNQRRSIDFGAATKEANRAYSHLFNALTMDALPDLAKTLNVSLRWMLGVDASAAVYSDRPCVENLYDYYSLLAVNRRPVIMKILEGGKDNG